MTIDEAKRSFLETIRRATFLGSAGSLLFWDMQTIIPPKGKPARAEVMGAVMTEAFRLTTGEAYGALLAQLADAELDTRTRRMVQVAAREYGRMHKIPVEEYEAYQRDVALSDEAWRVAKQKNDFTLFAPHLQKMIDYQRKFATYWGYQEHPYDALLESYEPGLTVRMLDDVFGTLLRETRALLAKVRGTAKEQKLLVSDEAQMAVSRYLLEAIGYDLEAGNLYTTEHPFSSTIHAGDSRITTKFHPYQPNSAIFAALHEGGHGMYEQNVDPSLSGTNLCGGASMGLHESQSRLWENIVGRSRAFWEVHLPEVNRLAGRPLAEGPEAYYKSINAMHPSLVRIEADELTYNIHIIIRYELEKMILAGDVTALDLPALWNAKYQEYLGVTPPSDAQGILQDTHCGSGLFGYFPSYAIGNLYGAQIAATMERDLGPLDRVIREEDGLRRIRAWLVERIYSVGMLEEPGEILRRVTGEDMNPQYLIDYLAEKVRDVYGQ